MVIQEDEVAPQLARDRVDRVMRLGRVAEEVFQHAEMTEHL